jgi:peroxiredoxin
MSHPRPTALQLDRRTLLVAGTSGLVIAAAGGMTLGSRPAHAAPQVGAPAPDFSAVDSNGVTQSLPALRGKTVVLEWTNHDCPFVRKHYNANNMQTLQREATASGVVWLSVISSPPGEQGHVPPEKANELTKSRNAAPTAVLMDPQGKMGRAYGAQVTPHMYIIGADGKLLYMGGIDSIASTRAEDLQKATPYFRNALQAVLKGEAISNAVTRPYGCAVKYTS